MDNFKSNSKKNKIEKEWADLNKELDKHNYLYHGLDQPEISDLEYDKIKLKLIKLEKEYSFLKNSKSILNKVKINSLKIIRSSNGNVIRILRKQDLKNWNFIPTTQSNIKMIFESFKTNIELDKSFSTPYVFIVDRDLSLRGRDDDEDIGVLYGFDSQSVAEINNKMVDDVKIILAEYRLALKKNDSLFYE